MFPIESGRRRAGALCGLVALALSGCAQEYEEPVEHIFRCADPGYGGAGIIALEKATISGTADIYASETAAVLGNELVDLSGNIYIDGDVVSAEEIKTSGQAMTIVGDEIVGVDAVEASSREAEAEAASENNRNAELYVRKGNKDVQAVDDGEVKLSGQQKLTMPAGDYYFEKGMSVSGQANIDIEGPVRIYVAGPVSISGTTTTNTDETYPFEIISVASDGISLSGTSETELHIYAPQSDVSLSGTTDFNGTILGKVVTISGTAAIGVTGDAAYYYDDNCVTDDDGDGDDGDDSDGGDDGDDGDVPKPPGAPDDGDPPDPPQVPDDPPDYPPPDGAD